ncbi:SRPBCC family protein [Gallaecimonas pentaromativorans]|uniref:Uncharacterized protein YndB with AHSA1/START domain n=1 Tax=Gallaecimonas pentaromativorans TaxID=584787 RepID=A0A3N1PYN2_9GAMM|nr:SRPBCC family protein [Gallaecimonas pentaromativorans]ROQ29676.1 uncharacterized protein YndB with AHSA1/START domain [Gallaecimonas pentaromativorans]
MQLQVQTLVKSDLASVWQCWITPEHIVHWNAASDDWHTTRSTQDVRLGGRFLSRMEAKDGSMGFDFEGTFTKVVEHQCLEYVMDNGRCVTVLFEPVAGGIKVTETFDAEDEHPPEMQQQGWQAILDNFAHYVEHQRR